MKTFQAFSESAEDADYRGAHRAPTKRDGAPLHDVSGVYPDDIYTLPLTTAARYYGHAVPADTTAMSIIQRLHHNPHATVKVYRAVPDLNRGVKEKLTTLGRYFAYVNRYGFPPMNDALASTLWARAGYDPDKFFDAVRRMIADLERTLKTPMQIARGDWVTTVRTYAVDHGDGALRGSYTILSKTVPAKHLFTDGNSIYEFGYDPS